MKREKSLLDKIDTTYTPPIEKEVDSKQSSIQNQGSPDIVIQSPSLSEADKGKVDAQKGRLGTSDSTALTASGVRMRQKSPVSNHMHQVRKSWRQTPVIAPDLVEMILTGEIFESEDGDESCENPLLGSGKKLDTCVEEEEETIKKLSPVTSRKAEKHAPILKSSKSVSPDHTPIEKRVSINSEPLLGEERPNRLRRKFLSADERTRILDSYDSKYRESSPPPPDMLSMSMDMRQSGGAEQFPRLRLGSLSHSLSTPNLTEIMGNTENGAKAKRVERSNSKRRRGRSRNDAYLDSTQISMDMPTSPRRKSGSMSFSPRLSASSITTRLLAGSGINRAFSSFRRTDREFSSESRNRGSRTLM